VDSQITDANIRRLIKMLDKQPVPQKGRYIEYMGTIYHEGSIVPDGLRPLLARRIDALNAENTDVRD
jgi:hypothetical protein